MPQELQLYSPLSEIGTFTWDFTVESACVDQFDYIDDTSDEFGIVSLAVSGAGAVSQSITF